MRFNSVAEFERWLEPLAARSRHETGRTLTLERTRQLAKAVGNPHQSLSVIHIAGTSGKTSTSYFIESGLRSLGAKTGLTVSPHIDSVAERVQINGAVLDDETFRAYAGEFAELVEYSKLQPTYFECMIVFAYWVFTREKVDYAVVETGLGGLHDSTNIAQDASKLCVITDIGLDHQNVLGDIIEQIAEQKAGIIWPGNHVVMFEQPRRVVEQVERRVHGTPGASLQLISDPRDHHFLQRNQRLATAICEVVAKRDGLNTLAPKTTRDVIIPARFEHLTIEGKTVIYDGAHNGQKMTALLETLDYVHPNTAAAAVVAFKATKAYAEPLELLLGRCRRVYATTFEQPQDAPIKAVEVSKLAAVNDRIEVCHDPLVAFNRALRSDCAIILVTGSFYLIAQLRSQYKPA